jgi:hypothetical protein
LAPPRTYPLDPIHEMAPWSFNAATKIKSDKVQPDGRPTFITYRLVRHYVGST